MSVLCSIQFKQGVTVGGVGVALMGSLTTPVVVGNALRSSSVIRSRFTLIDAPPASALYPLKGTVVQDGIAPTYTFVPDTQYGYLIQQTDFDAQNNGATDVRCFGVLDANGLFIPPYEGDSLSLNFILLGRSNTRGWAPFMEAWLAYFLGHLGGGGYTVETLGPAFGSPTYSGLANRILLVDPTGGVSVTPLAAALSKGNWLQCVMMPNVVMSSTNKFTLNPAAGGNIQQLVPNQGIANTSPVVLSSAGASGSGLSYFSDGSTPPNLYLTGF